jgi:integrase
VVKAGGVMGRKKSAKMSPKALQAYLDKLNADLPDHCSAWASRHGKPMIYFRKKGITGTKPIRIFADFYTERAQFHLDYAMCLEGQLPSRHRTQVQNKAQSREAPEPVTEYTLRWLCEDYFGNCTAWKTLKKDGRRVRRLIFEGIWAEPISPGSKFTYGDCPLINFNTKSVEILQKRAAKWQEITDDEGDPIEKPSTPEAGNSRVKYLRGLLAYAKAKYPHLVPTNWAKDVAYYKGSGKGFHTWTLDEIDLFRSKYEIGTRERLAFEILFYTGQRRGDFVDLGWHKVRNGLLTVVQEKNRGTAKEAVAYIPILPPLQVVLDASQTKGILGRAIWFVQENGQPYTKESFGNWFRDVCDRIGLTGCSSHGLRKACVVHLVSEDYTPHDIMAVTGHRTLKEIDRYSREYARQQPAEAILDKWIKKYEQAA